jgi:hypothetical protein
MLLAGIHTSYVIPAFSWPESRNKKLDCPIKLGNDNLVFVAHSGMTKEVVISSAPLSFRPKGEIFKIPVCPDASGQTGMTYKDSEW